MQPVVAAMAAWCAHGTGKAPELPHVAPGRARWQPRRGWEPGGVCGVMLARMGRSDEDGSNSTRCTASIQTRARFDLSPTPACAVRLHPRAILTPVPDADRHIDDDDLERYVQDQLSENDAAPIDEHLLACQQCQDRLAQVNQRVQAMRASRRRLG